MKQSGINDLEAYIKAVERNKDIKKWIREKGFVSFEEMFPIMEAEKPEWAESLKNSTRSMIIIRKFFRGK